MLRPGNVTAPGRCAMQPTSSSHEHLRRNLAIPNNLSPYLDE
jgi:hypothetical protein